MSVTLTLFQATGMIILTLSLMIVMAGTAFIKKCYASQPPRAVKNLMQLGAILGWVVIGYFLIPICIDVFEYPSSAVNKDITIARIHYSRGGSQSFYENREKDYSRGYELNSRSISFVEGERVKLTYLKRSRIVLSATKIP